MIFEGKVASGHDKFQNPLQWTKVACQPEFCFWVYGKFQKSIMLTNVAPEFLFLGMEFSRSIKLDLNFCF